jgi:NTP pyrophosphatase (non-canonical NTP hydrolase)
MEQNDKLNGELQARNIELVLENRMLKQQKEELISTVNNYGQRLNSFTLSGFFSLRQKELSAWQDENFGIHFADHDKDMILGMMEELGELAHFKLKGIQGIRGVTPEIAREKIKDAFVDCVIFGVQLMTDLKIDAEEAFTEISTEVMKRDWKNNPTGEGESQHNA